MTITAAQAVFDPTIDGCNAKMNARILLGDEPVGGMQFGHGLFFWSYQTGTSAAAASSSLSNATVAAAGTGQSTFTAMTAQLNAVTGADGTKGVALPAASGGRAIYVVNTDQSNPLKVAPINGGSDKINSLTTGTGVFTMGAARAAWFVPVSATQWYVTGDAAVVGTPTEQDLDGLTATTAEINLAADLSVQTETLIADGAVSVVKRYTKIEDTGTGVYTLAAPDATMVGAVKVIEMTADNGDCTLALTNVTGHTAETATFNDVGDNLVLVGGAAGKWIYVSATATLA